MTTATVAANAAVAIRHIMVKNDLFRRPNATRTTSASDCMECDLCAASTSASVMPILSHYAHC